MKNANPRDQGGKLIAPNDDITTGACADEDLDRWKLVDVLRRVFDGCLQRDELLSGNQLWTVIGLVEHIKIISGNFVSTSLARVMHIMTQPVVRCWKAKFGYRAVHASSDGG
ncbi:hypothetical protein [Rhizobium ruizarguesonis]|uniref:hypothetical protein n=1 Tax=Rhizobium ruizarguesonis TaxID=2081791 RepID=UPI0013EEAE9C|nr:hypothetical protein [Rhizobium ruizarguesonis]